MTPTSPRDPAPRSPARLVVVVGAVLLVAVLVVVVLLRRDDGTPPREQSSGPSPSPTGTSTSGPPPTLDADGSKRPTPSPGQSEPAVAETSDTTIPKPVRATLEEEADLRNGVTVSLTRIESVRGVGRGPGESSGPALRLTVRVANDSAEAVDMSYSVVTLEHGPDRSPASDLSAPGVLRFPATIGAGRSGEGRFVFRVPRDERGLVRVDFRYSTEAPTAVFTGSVSG